MSVDQLSLPELREFVLPHLPATDIARLSATSKALRSELTAPEAVHWTARSRARELFLHPDRIATLEHLHIASAAPRAWVVNFEFACLEVDDVPGDARAFLQVPLFP
jgi:hypothetical protein